MIKPLVLSAIILGAQFAAPAFAQTVGNCPADAGAAATSQPSWVLFDLGSAVLMPEAKPTIAQAVTTAKAANVRTVSRIPLRCRMRPITPSTVESGRLLGTGRE